MHARRSASTIPTVLIGITLSAGLVLAAGGCAEPRPQPSGPDVQAIDASTGATGTALEATYTPRPTATPTLAGSIATIVADTSQTKGTGISVAEVQVIVDAAFAAAQGDYSFTLAQVYKPPSGRWSIQHPESWTIDLANVPNSEETRLAGKLDGRNGRASVAVEVRRFDDDGLLTVDASTDDVILPNLGLLDDFRLLSRSTQAFRGTFVEELVFSHNSTLGPTIALMIVIRSSSDLYTIRGEAASPKFEHLEDQVRAIVYSFRTQDDWNAP